MVREVNGNLVEADVEALVNTVNCVGCMGKGVALEFKRAFPNNYQAYRKACLADRLRPGEMFVYETGSLMNPRYIFNFPSKLHWRDKSRLGDIELGLRALVWEIEDRSVSSIAIPALGCGSGGLQWTQVRPLILSALSQVPQVDVLLYQPSARYHVRAAPADADPPRITAARALLIGLLHEYPAGTGPMRPTLTRCSIAWSNIGCGGAVIRRDQTPLWN